MRIETGTAAHLVILRRIFSNWFPGRKSPLGFIVQTNSEKFLLMRTDGVREEFIVNPEGGYSYVQHGVSGVVSHVDSLVKFCENNDYVLAIDFTDEPLCAEPYPSAYASVLFGNESVSLILFASERCTEKSCVFIGASHLVPCPPLQICPAFKDAPGICCGGKFIQAAYACRMKFDSHIDNWKL